MTLHFFDFKTIILEGLVVLFQGELDGVIVYRKKVFVILHGGDGGPFVRFVQLAFQYPALGETAGMVLRLVASDEEVFLGDDRLGVVELNPAGAEADTGIIVSAPYGMCGVVHQAWPALVFSTGVVTVLSRRSREAAEGEVRAR